MAAERVHWNVPHITSERFDNEVVVVNFDSGRYHSIQGDGVVIWHWLEQPATLDGLVARALGQFAGDRAELEGSVRSFVAQLMHEQLIVAAASAERPAETVHEGPSAITAFRVPVLTTYTDMQELLWLDPIHEVDESGWPVVRNDPGN